MFKAQILETFKMKKTDVAASLCCITNHPKTTRWLKTTIFYQVMILQVSSLGQAHLGGFFAGLSQAHSCRRVPSRICSHPASMSLLTYLALGWSKGLVISVMCLSSSSMLSWLIRLVVSVFQVQQERASPNAHVLFKYWHHVCYYPVDQSKEHGQAQSQHWWRLAKGMKRERDNYCNHLCKQSNATQNFFFLRGWGGVRNRLDLWDEVRRD